MILHIVSTTWVLYDGSVQKVTMPAVDGMLCILPNHVNLATVLKSWDISYIPDETPVSALDSFADHTNSIAIQWWMALIEDDTILIAVE